MSRIVCGRLIAVCVPALDVSAGFASAVRTAKAPQTSFSWSSLHSKFQQFAIAMRPFHACRRISGLSIPCGAMTATPAAAANSLAISVSFRLSSSCFFLIISPTGSHWPSTAFATLRLGHAYVSLRVYVCAPGICLANSTGRAHSFSILRRSQRVAS